ncbi:DUF1700 domain-containing protein [Massilia horti]|uniref:DUF1700 domain-containing protein n=1 Tax=Massilia horti TaxID=2562153 RepID=A0A4Y9SQH2_9BURK|nr:DUF1700 domain-containing protein [Massilia horti]TFW28910.1 DUF1700 domain-containing protein [Massilia horti]
MHKLEYLDALKRAMVGLPPETQAKTLAGYEQLFVDGVAAGRSEEDVANELDDPRKIAMTLRASKHLHAFQEKKNPANLLRMLVTFAGLSIFNLFMVVPAIVFSALLTAVYACALGFYVAGIAVTASGLAGANELMLNVPQVIVHDADSGDQTRITISESGVQMSQDKSAQTPGASEDEAREPRVLRSAEAVAGRKIRISSEVDAGSRTTQTAFGLGMVLGGIALFLLAIVVTRYTFIGAKRYLQMNLSLLRGS